MPLHSPPQRGGRARPFPSHLGGEKGAGSARSRARLPPSMAAETGPLRARPDRTGPFHFPVAVGGAVLEQSAPGLVHFLSAGVKVELSPGLAHLPGGGVRGGEAGWAVSFAPAARGGGGGGMDQVGPLPDELGVLRSLQFNQLLSPHFQHSGPKFSSSGVCPVPFLCCTTGDHAQKAVQC